MLQFGPSVSLVQSRRDGGQWCDGDHIAHLVFSQTVVQGPGEIAKVLTKIFRQEMLPGWSLGWRDTTNELKWTKGVVMEGTIPASFVVKERME